MVLVFGLEPLYRKKLYEDTIESAVNMQRRSKLKGFFDGVSFVGSIEAQVILLILTFNLMAKPAALYFWCAIAFINFAVSEL